MMVLRLLTQPGDLPEETYFMLLDSWKSGDWGRKSPAADGLMGLPACEGPGTGNCACRDARQAACWLPCCVAARLLAPGVCVWIDGESTRCGIPSGTNACVPLGT